MSGKAKTREAKVGCVFTQTGVDQSGYLVRDEQSTSYVGSIEPVDAFGFRIYAEAMRRGAGEVGRTIVLGDGAQWIWALADMHFPGAIQIVDLYHAREHLAEVAKAVYGAGSQKATDWMAARIAQLDDGGVRVVVASLSRLRPLTSSAREVVQSTIDYFRRNAPSNEVCAVPVTRIVCWFGGRRTQHVTQRFKLCYCRNETQGGRISRGGLLS